MPYLLIAPLAVEVEVLSQSLHNQGLTSQKQDIGDLQSLRFPEIDLILARGGHGKVQFAIHTQYLIQQFQDVLGVLCVGAAGALSPLVQMGDVVIAESTVEHDYRFRFAPKPLPQFAGSPDLLARFRTVQATGFRLHFGIVASGDEDVIDARRGQEIQDQTNGLCVAWEGAGGARTCRFYEVPFLEVRGVTDSADHKAVVDFRENVEQAMSNVGSLIGQAFSSQKQSMIGS